MEKLYFKEFFLAVKSSNELTPKIIIESCVGGWCLSCNEFVLMNQSGDVRCFSTVDAAVSLCKKQGILDISISTGADEPINYELLSDEYELLCSQIAASSKQFTIEALMAMSLIVRQIASQEFGNFEVNLCAKIISDETLAGKVNSNLK